MNRRKFIRHSVLGAGVVLGGRHIAAEDATDAPAYPFATLAEAMASAKFDPNHTESFTVVWAADVHFGIGEPENILAPMAHEINRMTPAPAFFGIIGDLILKASISFGQIPDDAQKKEAIEEFKLVKEHLKHFDKRIPIKMTLGNHDTYPGEEKCALFHTVFPDEPEYHAFTIKGVPFIFLNGGSSGLFDSRQIEWFRDQVRKLHKPDGTLITAVHQPSLGSVVKERGITAAFRDVLPETQGNLWMISGHIHRNVDTCFQLPKAIITQAAITAGNPKVWGTDHPAYWIYAFHNGKLAARICRRIGKGYGVAPPPPLDKAQPLLLPFEKDERILWKVMVGEGDKDYLVEAKKAAWCLNYWWYNEFLTYKFPLSLAGGKAKCFALLETAFGEKPRKYLASPDGTLWEDVTAIVERNGPRTSFPIPKSCIESGTLHIRVEQCATSGFALTT